MTIPSFMASALVTGAADDLGSAFAAEFARGLASVFGVGSASRIGFACTVASACGGSTAVVRSDATTVGSGDSTTGSVTAGMSGVRVRAAAPGATGSVAPFVASTCDVGGGVASAPLGAATEADAMVESDR